LGELDWLRGRLGKPTRFLWADGLAVHLGFRSLGDRALRDTLGRLASSLVLAQLNHLDMDYNPLNPSGVQVVLASPHLGRLTSLSLAQTGIGSKDVRALAGSPALAKLTSLSLLGNAIDTAGAQALAESPHLGNLARLDLRHNTGEIAQPARDALRARFGTAVLF
jgi:hypothetical protein